MPSSPDTERTIARLVGRRMERGEAGRDEPDAAFVTACMRRLWQACAGSPGAGRWMRVAAGAAAVAAVAAFTALAGAAVSGDSGARLVRALSHYTAPALAAGWLAAVLAALFLRSLAHNPTGFGTGIRTVAHLCAPLLLWVAAMHAGAWLEWQVRRTPIAYGTDWFYAEMYQEYIREPGGRVLVVTVAVTVAAPLVMVLAAWLACACARFRDSATRPGASPEVGSSRHRGE